MPAYYDEKTKSWYCKFNYIDWNGKRRQKMKRGFSKKIDAKDWEHRFIVALKYDSKTTIGTITETFLQEIAPRRRCTTIRNYNNAIKNYNVKKLQPHLQPFAKMVSANYHLYS